MSFIDYSQTADDHQSLLVLVRHTGTHLSNQNFSQAWEQVRRLSCIHVQGQKRNVFVRYKRGYPKENNAWGDFQTHRKVLGLISIGQSATNQEFQDLFDDYKKIKEEYANTIYNSRLIVFGMNADGTPIVTETEADADRNSNSSHEKPGSVIRHGNGSVVTDRQNGDVKKPEEAEKRTKDSSGAEVVFYPNLESMATDLDGRLQEFVTSLFYVLEGKRLDRSFERADRLQLLCAPFEKKDFVGVDTDTRTFKKKCTGRLRKHLADLCLQAGMPGEAILHYQTAIDLLRAVNDFLWIAGCYEGLSSASVILASPKMAGNVTAIKRNLSFTDKRAAMLQTEKAHRAALSNNFANGLDLAESAGSSSLNPDDIIEKYREAITHYSKFKSAAMIEMEASLKACRVLIGQRKYLQASDFLQNVVYINLPSSEEDKIQRFSTLATLYLQIGFQRKAAFFKRVAGMQCVSPGTSAWHQCYYLLLQTLPGYKISLDPNSQSNEPPKGWPMLHYRILTELVYAARRMGNPQLAVRHMSFLLHSMFNHLSINERRESINGLLSLTSRCEGSSQPIQLDNGDLLPPVPFTRFPVVRSFTVTDLPPHLQPVSLNTNEQQGSPTKNIFIFTPIQSEKNTHSQKADFVWVCDEMCEVQLQVLNPMPDELKVSYMGLLCEGTEVECFPSNPSIPSESPPSLVKLICKPKTTGDLKILGYSTRVLGVTSKCYLDDLPHLKKKPLTVEVIPPLPLLTLKTSLPKSASFSTLGEGVNVVASANVSVFAGESKECLMNLHNSDSLSVTQLTVELESKVEFKEYLENVLSWSKDNISSQIPLLPSTTLCFSLCIYGYSDFLCQESNCSESMSPVSPNRSRSDSSDNRMTEALITVEYSGDVAYSAGYCRKCTLAVNIDIIPSLYILHWDVQPAESCDKCEVMFDLQNVTSHQIEVEYSVDKTLIIEPQQIRRIVVLISRVEFPAERTTVSPDVTNSPVWSNVKTVNHYSQYLSNFVDIRWSMSAMKVNGKVCIDHLTWSPCQIDILHLPAMRWEVRINDQLYLCPDVPKFTTGELIQVRATLFNDRGGECQDLTLTVNAIQNSDNPEAMSLPWLQDSLSIIDSNIVFHKLLCEKSCAVVACAFLFFCPGFFTLDISCCYSDTNLDSHSWKCIPMPKVLIEN